MKNFFIKLSKVHPVPHETSPNPTPQSPNILNSPGGTDSARSPQLQKKLSLQTQSFSPRPILKRKSVANPPKRSSLRSQSIERDMNITTNLNNNSVVGHESPLRRKTTHRWTKVYPEDSHSKSVDREELDPAARKLLKKKEKLAELKRFEQKFDENKLAEKARGFLKRSNTFFAEDKKKTHKSQSFRYGAGSFVQRSSENNGNTLLKPKGSESEDAFFREERAESKGIPSYNRIDFMEDGKSLNDKSERLQRSSAISMTKKTKMRKQRVNYRLRYDDKYKNLRFIIFPDDPFRMKWDLIILL